MKKFAIMLFMVCCSGTALAAPVTWTFQGVVLEEPAPGGGFLYGGLTGSFDYDADTNTYSNILIQSEKSGPMGAATYTDNAPLNWRAEVIESPSGIGVVLNSGDLDPAGDLLDAADMTLTLVFASALTNAGGTVGLSGGEALIGPAWGLYSESTIISGTVSTVPVPAAVWLFGSAVSALGLLRRRRLVCAVRCIAVS